MDDDRSLGAAQPTQRRFRCVVVGEGTLPLSCADVLLDRGHDVVALVAPVAEAEAWARERRIPLISPESDLAAALEGVEHDYLFSVVNHTMLRESVLARPARGAINYHDAPLPRYAGMHATSWAILAGERAHAVTWHEIVERVDAGRILMQRTVPVADDDTALSLDTKCYEAAVSSFSELIAGLESDTIVPREQDLSARSYFARSRRPAGAGALSWEMSAAELDALSRALDFGVRPNPLAVPALHIGGEAYACGSVRRRSESTDAAPGTITGLVDGTLLIATRDGIVGVSRLSSMTGEPIEADVLMERHGLRVGSRLPSLDGRVVERLRDLYESASRHESHWTGVLADPRPPVLPELRNVRTIAADAERRVVAVRRPESSSAHAMIAAAAAYLHRVNDGESVDVDVVLGPVRERATGIEAIFRTALPWHLEARDEESFGVLAERVATQLTELERRGPFPRDLFIRTPVLRTADARRWADALPVAVAIRDTPMDGRDDAAVTFVVGDGRDEAWLVYDPMALDDAAALRLADGWATIANDGSARSSAAIGELEVLTAGERALLAAWNATDEAAAPRERLHDAFSAQARRSPRAHAVTIDGRSLTYAELDARSTQLAWALRERGVGPDVLVGICLERSLEMMIALLGTLKAGGAYLPLDPDHPPDRLAFVVADAAPRVVLTTSALRDRLPVSDGSTFVLDEMSESLSRQRSDALPESGVGDGHLAYVIYTSGSTGAPKGVMVPHEAAGHYVRFMRDAYPLGADDAVLQKAPIGFDASVLELFVPITAGARLVLAAPAGHHDLRYILRLIREEGVTVVQFVPSVLAAIAELPEFRDACAGVRLMFCGGEALPMELALRVRQQLPGTEIHNLYGPTEVTVYATTWAVADAPAEGLAPIGRPIRNTRAYVVDSRRRLVPIGVNGELCLAGVQVARGYLARPELTAERFLDEPGTGSARAHARMYRTGDLARWRDDGTLEYRGRADHQVKVRGFRVELGEIEQALGAHPGVRECAVICRGEGASARIVAYWVATGSPADTAALRTHLASRLPDYMVPSAFVALDQLPLSRNGKLDRRALPDPVALDDAASYVAPTTSTEQAVSDAWASVLRLPRVGIDDDVFGLGANSLLAMRVLARLEGRVGVSLPLRLVFDSPTPRAMARSIDEAVARGGGVAAGPRAEGRTEAPLAFGQELLWLLERAHPGVAAYNVPELFELRGPVDETALREALDDVVGRHASLRTAFVDRGGSAVQLVSAGANVPWTIEDLRGDASDERDTRELRIVDELVRRPFELSRAPLLRAALLRRTDDVRVLLLVHHHLVTDGWSRAVLLRDLGAAYLARLRAAGDRPGHARNPDGPTYADFATWQRARAESGALASQLTYWREQLRDATQVLELPVDHPRTATRRFDAGVATSTWPRELTERLRELGAAHGATLFMTLLAAYQAVLSRYSGQEDFVVGTPTAGRPREVTDDAVGYFATMLPLRADLSGEPEFVELLRRVRHTCLGALEHGDVPFELLLRELAAAPTSNRTPLFQVMFSLQNTDRADLALEGVSVARRERTAGWATYDQWLTATEEGDGLRLSLEYRADLFDADSMNALLEHLRVLLTAAVDAPARRVAQLPMLTTAERQRVLTEWNRTDIDLGDAACVHALISAQAVRTPRSVAVVDDRRALTYAELDARANQLAHHLIALGVGPGALVGLAVERSTALMVALLGIMKTGAAYVPLDASYPKDRVAFMLRDSAAQVLVTDESQRADLPAFDGTMVSLDGDASVLAQRPAGPPSVAVTPDDLAYVIYTSGSTGTPKGAMLPHRAVTNYLRWMHHAYEIGARDCVLQKAPVSFDASVWELYLPLIAGGRVFFAQPDGHRDPAYLLRTIAERGVTVLQSVPSLLGVLLATPGFSAACGGIRLLVLGGEELPGWLAVQARALMPLAEIQNLYGPTEAAVYATAWSVPAAFDGGVVPIGRPIANDRAYVLTVGGTEPTPIGVAGELCLGGAGVGDGYLNRPDRTSAAFVNDPFATGRTSGDTNARMYRTGDLARWRRDGVLEYLGRIDHQVKVRGFRVELGEIEAAVRRCAGVRDCAVALRNIGDRDTRLVAYVVPAAGSVVDGGALRSALVAALPEHMLPSAFVALDALPLNANGKLDRRALPAPPDDASERPFVAPRTGLEQVVAMEWAEILGMERVSADDDFFALGGHSLLGMRILARLSSTLGRPLPLRLLFETRTVTALAAALAQEMAPANESRETEELLAALEQLSDEEALRLLESNDGNILAS